MLYNEDMTWCKYEHERHKNYPSEVNNHVHWQRIKNNNEQVLLQGKLAMPSSYTFVKLRYKIRYLKKKKKLCQTSTTNESTK